MKHFYRKSSHGLMAFYLLFSILTFTVMPSDKLLAGEIKLDKIINDIKSSIKHHRNNNNNNHQYEISKEVNGKKYNFHCDTKLSPEEIAKAALFNPSSIKTNCYKDSDKK